MHARVRALLVCAIVCEPKRTEQGETPKAAAATPSPGPRRPMLASEKDVRLRRKGRTAGSAAVTAVASDAARPGHEGVQQRRQLCGVALAMIAVLAVLIHLGWGKVSTPPHLMLSHSNPTNFSIVRATLIQQRLGHLLGGQLEQQMERWTGRTFGNSVGQR